MQREEEVIYLYLDDIIPNRFQPREVFDERPLKELAVSIKEHGVIQPIIVRKVNDKYEIIAGERRYKASALAGLTKIPAIIRDLDDKESSKVALLENLQRKNLNPIEEAKTYQKILELDEMTQEELAKTMGKSQSSVANKLRLLSLPEDIQQALLQEKISERHARALLNIKDSKEQHNYLNEIINNKMTVRQLEDKIKEKKQPEIIPIQEQHNTNNIENIEIKDSKEVSGQENYISNSPLIPSFLNDETIQDSEPILITSEGENLMESQENEKSQDLLIDSTEENDSKKFINFGEIDSEEDEEESNNEDSQEISVSTNLPIDINNLKENTKDISTLQENDNGADLDNLLRINTSSIDSSLNDGGDFKFFSPAQEALNESESEPIQSGDYFKAPELINVDIPTTDNTMPTKSVNLNQANYDLNNETKADSIININSSENILQDSIDIIRDTIKKIEEKGLKIDSDEMNLENSYQVVIKIEK